MTRQAGINCNCEVKVEGGLRNSVGSDAFVRMGEVSV